MEHGHHNSQLELKIKEFDILSKQFKDEIKSIEKFKSNLVIN